MPSGSRLRPCRVSWPELQPTSTGTARTRSCRQDSILYDGTPQPQHNPTFSISSTDRYLLPLPCPQYRKASFPCSAPSSSGFLSASPSHLAQALRPHDHEVALQPLLGLNKILVRVEIIEDFVFRHARRHHAGSVSLVSRPQRAEERERWNSRGCLPTFGHDW